MHWWLKGVKIHCFGRAWIGLPPPRQGRTQSQGCQNRWKQQCLSGLGNWFRFWWPPKQLYFLPTRGRQPGPGITHVLPQGPTHQSLQLKQAFSWKKALSVSKDVVQILDNIKASAQASAVSGEIVNAQAVIEAKSTTTMTTYQVGSIPSKTKGFLNKWVPFIVGKNLIPWDGAWLLLNSFPPNCTLPGAQVKTN